MLKRLLRLLFVAFLAVVAYGVFGPNPGENLEKAAKELRRVEQEVRAAAPGGPTVETPANH